MEEKFSLSFKHYGEAGKSKIKASHDFDFFRFEKIEDNMMILEGCLFRIITKGKNKGNYKWLHEGERKIVISRKEVIDWCKKYENETCNCSYCFGEGMVMESWNYKTGTKYKDCPKCSGSGLKG